MSKVLVLYYSSYGHIETLAEAVAEGARATGATVDVKRVPETAPLDVAKAAFFKLDQPAPVAFTARAVAELFPTTLHASSTKGWTGHTLGAAGIVESVFALLALRDGLLPGILNSGTPDPACGPQVRFANATADVRIAMNNSFGVGGNNCSLVFARA